MKEIGAFEAKTKFGQLLDWVESGGQFVITRRGKIVARMLPPIEENDLRDALAAAARIRARRHGMTLDGLTVKDLIAEGRV